MTIEATNSHSGKSYAIRRAQPNDVLAIVDLALRVRGVLHFPPAQLEWMLKQVDSDFFTLLAFEDSGKIQIQGFLIAKRKQRQCEILEIYSEPEHARAIYGTLLKELGETLKREAWEGLTALVPGNDVQLQEAFLDAAFYRAKIIEKYYTGGESAELWIRAGNPVAREVAGLTEGTN